jgi:hypothetical protein
MARVFARFHPTGVAFALALWGGWYAAYRLYYAFGGTVGMIGQPRSPAQFREINLRGGVIILMAALLPVLVAWAWRHRQIRNLVGVIGWIAFVACCTHALTSEILRLLSLAGIHPVELPAEFWLSVNRDKADLQDVLLNEPWFFIEGLPLGAVRAGCPAAVHAPAVVAFRRDRVHGGVNVRCAERPRRDFRVPNRVARVHKIGTARQGDRGDLALGHRAR